MPPLVILIAAAFIVALLTRLFVAYPCCTVRQLPFIVSISHGICPKCGASHPDKVAFALDADKFWHHFSCKCGYEVKAHIAGHD